MGAGATPCTLWMAYCCPAFDGESFEAWQERAMAEYRLGESAPLPECHLFDEQGETRGLKPKAV
jgi:hypothetical protein